MAYHWTLSEKSVVEGWAVERGSFQWMEDVGGSLGSKHPAAPLAVAFAIGLTYGDCLVRWRRLKRMDSC